MKKVCLLLCLLFCLSGCGAVSEVPQPVQPLPPVEQPQSPVVTEMPEVQTPDQPEVPSAETESPAEPEVPSVDSEPPVQAEQPEPAPAPQDKPQPVLLEEATVGEETYTCTISISCETVLSNLDKLDSDKHELIPADGWILPETTATFYQGESVFDVLIRTCKENKIHMEYMDTPLYNSAYIEGIGNLYEFDCGNESGWMYCVNDWFPNYGCSQYQLKDGDAIRWIYTCDLGRDVGDNSWN